MGVEKVGRDHGEKGIVCVESYVGLVLSILFYFGQSHRAELYHITHTLRESSACGSHLPSLTPLRWPPQAKLMSPPPKLLFMMVIQDSYFI